MAPKFGTSGLRGLVAELSDDLVADYTRAFLSVCRTGGALFVGWDLRPSSPRIAAAVTRAARAEGVAVVRVGAVPTPGLALAAAAEGAAAIMVTGSHIPADRNGLKFYTPEGEIAKADEAAIAGALGRPAGSGSGDLTERDAAGGFVARYVTAYGPEALAGLRIGVYQHSSVARDILTGLLAALGAAPVPQARSETFVPVDTEAVDRGTRDMLAGWCDEHGLDAVVSTDGDGDRPMVADHRGRIVPGDVLGPLTAQALGAESVVTPVSSNTAVDAMGFARVIRTRIGSPHVIAAMAAEPEGARVVGYEANGGFLLGFAAEAPAGPLAALATRDSVLPILAPLAAAKARRRTLADLVATLPARFTAADRIAGVATEASASLLERLTSDPVERAAFFDGLGAETGLDLTDGLRVHFEGSEIVHLRPSGNAPECRCYAEADSPARAEDLLARHLARLRDRLT